ncbi:MAG: MBL fold metallo-hydrolase RNA specificity domain-containing protein [Candidatus Micrarchaeia archaeon]
MDKNLCMRLNNTLYGLDVLGGEINYISHAHTDHSYALKAKAPIFCSDITSQILGIEYNENEKIKEKTEHLESNSKKQKSAPVRIPIPKNFKFADAGHILGSTQLEAQTDEFGKLVYTGDFKLRDGLTLKSAKVLECDTLICECTYGTPEAKFPKPEEVYENMQKWSKQNSNSIQLWGGYSTGKAQELIKFLNDYTNTTPIVPPQISQICAHYKRNGVKLEWLDSTSSEAQEQMRCAFCAVFPPHQLNKKFAWQIASAHKRTTKVAVATGWTGFRKISADASFPLSDHADFGEIYDYALSSNAKKVFLVHGENTYTAKKLKEKGINAFAIDQIQKEIRE